MIEINYGDSLYPNKLKNICNYPKKIYVKGNLELLNSIAIAVVGSRHNSQYGERMCKRFTKELVQNGVTIVSGLATGIDTLAHTTCLENGGNTIAVLPCGIDNIFPKENEGLSKDIINLGGTIITEYDANEEANSDKFLQRNRIVAGLTNRNFGCRSRV